MIRIYILRTENLSKTDFLELVNSLPFGEAEKERLLAIKNSKHKWESLGGLVALWRLMERSEFPYDGLTVIERTPSGKPYFNFPISPHFSISHSQGIAAAAICDYKYGEIGFDIEVIDQGYDFPHIAERFFTDAEKAELEAGKNSAVSFFSIWTAKEAYAKLGGQGLSDLFANKDKPRPQNVSLSKLNISLGDRQAVLSVCSYVAEQPIQIYTDNEA